jgi:hypothetical protein
MIDQRYLYLTDDLILLDKNMPNNGKSRKDLYQIHAGGEIINRDNILRRLDLKILSEYFNTDSKISLAFSDSQIMGDIRDNRNENDDHNGDKKRYTNIGRINQNQIYRERASDLFRADKNSELEEHLTINTEEQNGIIDIDENDKNCNNINYQQKKDEKITKKFIIDEMPKIFQIYSGTFISETII